MSDKKLIRMSQHSGNSRLKELQTELVRYQDKYKNQNNKLERLQRDAGQLMSGNKGDSKTALISFKKLNSQKISHSNHS